MLMSGVLLREVDDFIQRMMSEGGDSAVKGRLCALIFLISQMSQPVLGGETGLRATAPFLADLLVEDLAEDGARLRKRVPELLDELVAEGRIVQDGDEYRLLTQEDAEWEKDYRTRLAAVRDDATRMNQLRSERLMAAVEAALGSLKLTHGASKTPRKLDIHWGRTNPSVDDGGVPVWMRDEWSVERVGREEGGRRGRRREPDRLRLPPQARKPTRSEDALASSRRRRGDPSPADPADRRGQGRAAGDGIAPRPTPRKTSSHLFGDVVARARVFQGGGTELTTTRRCATPSRPPPTDRSSGCSRSSRRATTPTGGRSSRRPARALPTRSTPLATTASRRRTRCARKCLPRSARAAPRAPTSRSASPGRRSAGRRTPSTAPSSPCSPPATSAPPRTARTSAARRSCRQTQIGKVTLYKEDEPPTRRQRLAVRGLLDRGGNLLRAGSGGRAAPCPPSAAQGPRRPRRRAAAPSRATGHRPPRRAAGARAETSASGQVADEHERLSADLERWRAADQQREKRETEWRDLQRLLRHADGLPVAEAVAPAVAAIRDGRQLLDEPDPIAPLLTELATALRAEVTQRAEQLADAQRAAVAELEAWPEWNKLDPADRDAIVAEAKLVAAPPPDVSTESKLLEALDAITAQRVDRPDQPRRQPPRPGPPAGRQEARAEERRREAAIRHLQARRRSQRRTSTSCGRSCSRISTPARP